MSNKEYSQELNWYGGLTHAHIFSPNKIGGNIRFCVKKIWSKDSGPKNFWSKNWVPGWLTATHWVQDLGGEVLYLTGHEGREEQEDGVLHQHHQHPQQSWDDGVQGCYEWSFCWINHRNFCTEGVYLDSSQIFKWTWASLDFWYLSGIWKTLRCEKFLGLHFVRGGWEICISCA